MTDTAPEPTPEAPRTLSPLAKRVRFTIAALAVYHIGIRVTLPGVDRARAWSLVVSNPGLMAYDRFVAGGLSHASVLALGIVPYLTGTVVVLLLSGLIPQLRRLRDDPASLAFDRWILGGTLAIGLLQGWGAAVAFAIPGSGPRLEIPILLAAGATFLAWLAIQITEHGVANGVVMILFITEAERIVPTSGVEFMRLTSGSDRLIPLVLRLALLVSLLLIYVRVITASRTLLLQDRDGPSEGEPPVVTLRFGVAGITPLQVAFGAMSLLALLRLAAWGSTVRWLIQAALILLATFMWTAFAFNAEDLLTRIRRFGFGLAEGDGVEASVRGLDQIVERMALPFALFLVAVTLVPPFASQVLGADPGFADYVGAPLLVLAALGMAISDGWRTHRDQRAGDDWTAVFEGETELDITLARARLERAGIPSWRVSTRAIATMGTLGLWESCRPTFPSVIVHRRLGGGTVTAQVRAADAERARNELRRFTEVQP